MKKKDETLSHIKDRAHTDGLPFNNNMVFLYFRLAWVRSDDYNNRGYFFDWNEGKVEENPYTFYYHELTKRLGGMSKYNRWFWDVLHDVHERGKSLKDLTQYSDPNDPEKDAWIKEQVMNPDSPLSKSTKVFSFPNAKSR